MRKPEPTAAQIEEARGLAAALDVAGSRALHRYFGDNGAQLKAALAEALETSIGTISRQTRVHDLPMQARMLGALRVLEPALFADVLDALLGPLGIRWHEQAQSQGTAEDLRAQSAKVLAASAEAVSGILQDVADGSLDANELEARRPDIERVIRLYRSLLEAMESQAGAGPKLREACR